MYCARGSGHACLNAFNTWDTDEAVNQDVDTDNDHDEDVEDDSNDEENNVYHVRFVVFLCCSQIFWRPS